MTLWQAQPPGEILRQCPVCLKQFRAERRTATYCSPKCRQRKHRKPVLEERLKEFYDTAHESIMGLVATGDRSVDSFRAQKRLQTLAVEIIQNMNDETRKILYEQIKEDFYRVYRDS